MKMDLCSPCHYHDVLSAVVPAAAAAAAAAAQPMIPGVAQPRLNPKGMFMAYKIILQTLLGTHLPRACRVQHTFMRPLA